MKKIEVMRRVVKILALLFVSKFVLEVQMDSPRIILNIKTGTYWYRGQLRHNRAKWPRLIQELYIT